MAKTQKISDALPREEWEALNSAGDVKRFLRSVILRTESGELDIKIAGCLGQLTSYLLKCMEDARAEDLRASKQGLPASSSLPMRNGADHRQTE